MKSRGDRTRIAIVGSAFRLPGVRGEELWEALLAGKDLVSSVETSRWAQSPYLHSRKSEPGAAYTFAAGSLGDIAAFDAAFFGISPREAEQMDPQQRLLLEMTWEAFENAAIRPSSMRGSRCGVYVGLSSIDYAYRRAEDLGSVDATTMTGNTGSIAANRLSYVFDLRGPSMVVDTACSSSLVALHQACQSIHHGECDSAFVGGISLHLHPYAFVGFSKASMLSRRGRCSVFDESGDGYVRAEGGAVVLLKPLAQAIADGNRILAVVAETGVNNDGRKTGLTVPSHTAQATLLREVYERAGIAPSDIDYLEAHGTGTPVGDPIEARAIGEALGQRRSHQQPLPIGSVKSNVGHLEAASGMAGLVKALYVLRHRRVPPNIHLSKPNPNIDFAGWNLAPVTEPLSLATGRKLVVGVSAFGFGGTNAHAVLTSFETDASRPAGRPNHRAPLMLSARSSEALREGARRMSEFLRNNPETSDYDIAYSAMFAREIHSQRLMVSGPDRASIVQALEQFATSGSDPTVITGTHRREASGPAFVFSGNGSQWVGMGLQLLEEDSAFREAVEETDSLFMALAGRSIVADLRAAGGASRLDRTEVAQPALFALQVGLTRSLETKGVRPIAVCGHSVGEVAAAWASGALTLEAAVHVIYERSEHQAKTRGAGVMAAVSLGENEASALLRTSGLGEHIVIAAINSPSAVTVAGNAAAVEQLEAILGKRRIACRRLPLDYAFHSSAMDPIREDLTRSLCGLKSAVTAVPLYSTVTGSLNDGAGLGAEYWWRNVREPVRFRAAIQAMIDQGVNTFVEIGPKPVLTSYLGEMVKGAEPAALVVPSLTSTKTGGERLESLVQQLELSGALQDATRLFPSPGRIVELPNYAWQRERFWHPTTSESLGLLSRHTVHPLLGHALAGDTLHWENYLDLERLPPYADHAVGGAVVFPAAGFVEMALAAGALREPGSMPVIEDFEILAPLLLERDHSKIVRLRIDPTDGGFSIVSRERGQDGDWRTHVTGRLIDGVPESVPALHLPHGPPDLTAAEHYAQAQALGLCYGPAFQSVSCAWFSGASAVGALELPKDVVPEESTALLHPAQLDGAFQLLIALACRQHDPASEALTFLPVRIGRLELLKPHARIAAAQVIPGSRRHGSRRALLADFLLFDAAGACVAAARNVRFRATSLNRGSQRAPGWIATRAVPMPRRQDQAKAVPLPCLDELTAACEDALHGTTRSASRLRFAQEVEPLLDALCAAFAERAIRNISEESSLDPEQLLASGRVDSSAVPLLGTVLQLLAEESVVEPCGTDWRWTAGDAAYRFPEPQDIWASLIADYPEHAAVIARAGAAGVRLVERLRVGASREPRERDIRESRFGWMDSCTQVDAAAVFTAVSRVLAAAATAQSADSRCRVLYVFGAMPREEFGAAVIPEMHTDHCEIVLAAPSQEALDQLQARYPAAAKLTGHVLDMDAGGLQMTDALGGRFDVVVLTDGLSGGSSDSTSRLESARRVLLENGLLVAIDQHASRAADLIYGLNRGWSARRSPQTWLPVLSQSGFGDGRIVLDVPSASTGPYLMVARCTAPAAEISTPSTQPVTARTWLIAHDETGYSAELARSLAAQLTREGQNAIPVTAAPLPVTTISGPVTTVAGPVTTVAGRVTTAEIPGTSAAQHHGDGSNERALDPTSRQDWERLIGDLQRSGTRIDVWVHLSGLDLTTAEAPVIKRLDVQQRRAAVLMSWLQACSHAGIHAECWVVGAQAGLGLLPAAEAASTDSPLPPPDRLRDSALWGLTRVAIQEFADLRLRWVDLVTPAGADLDAGRLAEEMLHPDAEDEILLTDAGRFVPRIGLAPHLPAGRSREDAPERHASALTGTGTASEVVTTPAAARYQLDFAVPGSFRNLSWHEDRRSEIALGAALGEGELEIEVRAAGLNFRDVMYAMGLLPDEAIEDGFCGPNLGMELSGVVLRTGPGVDFVPGDEVVAIAPGSFANRVRTHSYAVTSKPAEWSFAAAATVPTAFFTAWYSLAELANVQPGERVLIHGAAGGVGIAAIQIAKHLGAEVFATASAEKRDFVRLLGADHVFDSRSVAFADEVLHATGGVGVDVVLNSLAGEAMRRNLRVLRPFGRMIELGKRDFYENSRIGLRPFRNNISYFGVDADQLIAHRPHTARRVFGKLMALFAEGVLHPLPHRSFPAAEFELAFRQMQASRHIGKIVLSFPEGFAPAGPVVKPEPLVLRPDATYLVTGGLSGFGLQTARWLARMGARHLVLVSRRGGASSEAAAVLEEFAAADVHAKAIACDVADPAALTSALAEIEATMPPLKGVVHAAMVIEDALIRDMDGGQLQRVLAPKIAGGWLLHEATRHRDLDMFVLYSSATTLFGNPGQGAYVAANTALESLAAERQALGLPVTCVSWGPIEDTGYLARNEKIRDALVGRIGGRALLADQALDALEGLVSSEVSRIGLLELDWSVLGRVLPAARAPKFRELAQSDKRVSGNESAHDVLRWLAQLAPDELTPAVVDIVRGELAQILRIAPERIEPTVSLFDLGMDSLMAVELATSIDARLGVQLSGLSLSDAPTIERIAGRIAQQLRPTEESGGAVPGSVDPADQIRLAAARHASEVTEEEMTSMSAELGAAAPLSLTESQSS